MAVEHLPKIPNYQKIAYVYAIFCVEGDSGFVKVGYSTEPFKRVSSIIGGSPLTPSRIGMAKAGDKRDGLYYEGRLHSMLSSRRVAQEWFKYDLLDSGQKAEFYQHSQHGFGRNWDTFPYEAMKEMLRSEAAKAFAISQKAKRIGANPYDRKWMKGTKGAGSTKPLLNMESGLLRRNNCKLSSLE